MMYNAGPCAMLSKEGRSVSASGSQIRDFVETMANVESGNNSEDPNQLSTNKISGC